MRDVRGVALIRLREARTAKRVECSMLAIELGLCYKLMVVLVVTTSG